MAGKRALQGLNVLIVEDEYFLADDVASALSEAGATVVGPAGTVDDALRLCDGTAVDLAILDVNLRRSKAFPVADMLMESNIPFVFATGYSPAALPSRYKDVPHWEKPYDETRLVAAISELGAAANRRELQAPPPPRLEPSG